MEATQTNTLISPDVTIEVTSKPYMLSNLSTDNESHAILSQTVTPMSFKKKL